MKKFFKGLLLGMFMLSLSGCGEEALVNNDVYTTIYPTLYLTEFLYGEDRNVLSIYPSGADVSSYELTDMQKENYTPYHLILEEMFSPCSGGVVDFDEQGHPCHEIFMPAPSMRKALDAAHTSCLEYAQAALDRFGQYSPLLASARADGALEIFRQWFQKKPLSNRAALRDIIFPDPVYCDRLLSLEDKLDSHLAHATVFTATGFDDTANALPLASLSCPVCQDLPRIGLHIHIYNGALAQAFSRYLQQFPVPFDVFVTHVKTADRSHLQALFNQDVLPLANAVTIVQTPNRGRDVAPWLSGVGQELQKYNLCCHVHAKESVYAPSFGIAWRTYLLDMDPSQSHERLTHSADRMEAAGDDFQKRTRRAFLDLAQAEPERFLVVDAARSVEEVWRTIRADVDAVLARRTVSSSDTDRTPGDACTGAAGGAR